jgi:hypothetical protein
MLTPERKIMPQKFWRLRIVVAWIILSLSLWKTCQILWKSTNVCGKLVVC